MIVKTDAIVLKSMKYGETSKIITFFTQDFGKIKCIAKGARGNKSKFGSTLDPLQVVSIVFYQKEHRDLQLVTQADTLHQFKQLATTLESLAATFSIVELLNRVTHDDHPNIQLFHVAVAALQAINKNPHSSELVVQGFQLKAAAALGFAPNFERCGRCGTPTENISSMERIEFQVATGSFLCPACGPGGLDRSIRKSSLMDGSHRSVLVSISAMSLKMMKTLIGDESGSLVPGKPDSRIISEVGETLRLYLRYHVEGLKSLNADLLLNSLSHQEV